MSENSTVQAINSWVILVDVVLLFAGLGVLTYSLFIDPSYNGEQWLMRIAGLLCLLVGGQKR